MEIPRRMPELGQTLKGRYSLINLLGEGGFAKTYLADEKSKNRQVAVKVLKLNPTAGNIAAFSQEVTNMLLLQHDQILRVTDYEAQEKGVLPYLVAEYAPLGSLKDYVRRRGQPLGIEETISLLEQASWGIGYAHDTRDLVHRDIKPENLLLLAKDRLVVADFGIAKQLSPQVSLTTEQFSGTVPYAAPEQFQGKAVKASDQYALGVTAFFVLTGKLPFSGDMLEMFMKKTKGVSLSLVQAVEGLRRGERMWTILSALDPVVHQAIDPEAHKRHGSVTLFTKTLRDTYTEAVTEKPDKTVHEVAKPQVKPASDKIPEHEIVQEQPQADFPPKGSELQRPTVLATPKPITGVQGQGEVIISDKEQQKKEIQALLEKGKTFSSQKKYQEALAAYEQALELDPNFTDAYFNLGKALNALGRNKDAIAAYDLVIRLNPKDSEAYYNKGITLGVQGRQEEAIAAYDQAIKLNPGDSYAYLNKGSALYTLGRRKEALAAYDQAIRIDPNYKEAHYNKGIVLHALRMYEQALATYDQAIRIDPNYKEAYLYKGKAMHALGRRKEALATYDQAIRVDPNYKEAHYNKGIVLKEMNRYEEALKEYNKALELDPSNQEVKQNIDKLKENIKKK